MANKWIFEKPKDYEHFQEWNKNQSCQYPNLNNSLVKVLEKIRKSDILVEAITEALHQYMYEKINDSPDTEDEKKIGYLNKRTAKSTKEPTDKPTNSKRWIVTDAEHRTAPNSMNVRQEERNVLNAKKSAITRIAAEQTKK